MKFIKVRIYYLKSAILSLPFISVEYNRIFKIPLRHRNDHQDTIHFRALSVMSTLCWLITIGSYFSIPFVLFVIMMFDLDPFSYVVQACLTHYFPFIQTYLITSVFSGSRLFFYMTRFLICYLPNLVCMYEILRIGKNSLITAYLS